jgi:hypothetical protein
MQVLPRYVVRFFADVEKVRVCHIVIQGPPCSLSLTCYRLATILARMRTTRQESPWRWTTTTHCGYTTGELKRDCVLEGRASMRARVLISAYNVPRRFDFFDPILYTPVSLRDKMVGSHCTGE